MKDKTNKVFRYVTLFLGDGLVGEGRLGGAWATLYGNGTLEEGGGERNGKTLTQSHLNTCGSVCKLLKRYAYCSHLQ